MPVAQSRGSSPADFGCRLRGTRRFAGFLVFVATSPTPADVTVAHATVAHSCVPRWHSCQRLSVAPAKILLHPLLLSSFQCPSRSNGSNRGPIMPFVVLAPIARTPV